MAQGVFIGGRFFWNVDQRVGPGGANKIDDVQLVQLAYVCMGTFKAPDVPANLIALASQIDPRDSYSGAPNDILSAVIRLHQKIRGGTQDGVVSPIQNPSGQYASKFTWMIMALNANLFDVLKDNWPHVDRHFECPSELKTVSKTVFKAFG